jgi:Tfp pilus assembly protein PilV
MTMKLKKRLSAKNHPKKLISARGGFTLVEILISICVLTFGCLAVIHMHTTTLKGSNYSDNLTAAVFLAESEMERLKALNSSDLKDLVDDGELTHNNLNRLGETCPNSNCSNYPFKRVVNFYPNTPTSFSKHVEIDVTWRDNSGPHKVSYAGAITALVFE